MGGSRELNIYCLETTSWDAMLPLAPVQYKLLGKVELQALGEFEEIYLVNFFLMRKLCDHVEYNKQFA